ncbi:hypothetical protein CPC08DRAFT_821922 [Agrocybe pediades]|nr:hypothetical protein CPC08DRAFT_821922 [Agrocybe pediades]
MARATDEWKDIILSQLPYTSHCTENATCNPCKEISALEAQIHESISNLQTLLQRHRNKKTELNYTHSGIVRRLPPEVMSNIFEFRCAEAVWDHTETQFYYWVAFTPLRLGRVCRTWRQIAWNTPQLWTSLAILDWFFTRPNRVSLLVEWISRSKTLPLSIYIKGHKPENYIDQGPPESHRPVLDALAESSARWRHLFLRLPTEYLRYLFQPTQDLSRVNTIQLDDYLSLSPFNADPKLFRGAIPSPRHVSLYSASLKVLNIDWSRLVQLKANSLRIDDCLHILRSAPLIENCELDDVGYQRFNSTLSPPLVHENLKVLSFKCIDSGKEFFLAITLPNLIHFSYSQHSRRSGNSALPTFFQRSTPPLQKLELCNVKLSFEEMEALVQAVPTVSHLHLTMPAELYDHDEKKPFRDPFFLRLAQSPSDILPSLHTLEFSFSSDDRDRIKIPWKCIPGVVGPLLADENDPNGRSRPLRTFKFNNIDYTMQENIIPRSVRTRILALRQKGAEIYYRDDLIEESNVFKESVQPTNVRSSARLKKTTA